MAKYVPTDTHLYAFWKNDLPPFALGGKVLAITDDGDVFVKGYDQYMSSCFKKEYIIAIVPEEEGKAIHERLRTLEREYRDLTKIMKNIMLQEIESIKEKYNPADVEIPKQLPKPKFQIGDTVYNTVPKKGSYEPSTCNVWTKLTIDAIKKCPDGEFEYTCEYDGYVFTEHELLSHQEYTDMMTSCAKPIRL